ncbi:PKD domain-containing protein, partial [Flagellimonas marinaquae]
MKSFLKKGKLISMLALLSFFLGCSDDDEVLPEVVASFTQSVDQTTGAVSFTNTSQNATSYSWDFGNGNNSTAKNPVQTYENGEYTVVLTASNIAGNSDTATANITISIPDDEGESGNGFDSGLLTNGDFEAGVEPWIGNAANVQEEGGNSFNFANVGAAGN